MQRIAIAAAAGALTAAGTAHAQVNAAFSDQATVAGTLINPIVEDFNDEPVGDLDQNTPAAFNGFTVAANGTSSFTGDFAIDEDDPGDNSLTLFIDDTGGFISSFTFTFDNPVDTFAANFESPDSADGLSFNFSDGTSIVAGDIPGIDPIGDNYISFTSATPFTSVEIAATPGGFEAVSIDDVVTGRIPAPGAGAVLALAGLAASRRRR